MARFQAYQFLNKTVVANGKKAQFKDGYLETADKDIVEALRKDGSVVEVSSGMGRSTGSSKITVDNTVDK